MNGSSSQGQIGAAARSVKLHQVDDNDLAVTVNNENSFARAFGGDGGTCECRGGCPPGPPSVGDVTGSFPLSLFSQEKIFGEEREIFLASRPLRYNYKKPHQTNGGLSSTCMHVRVERDRQFPKFLFPPRLIPMCPSV